MGSDRTLWFLLLAVYGLGVGIVAKLEGLGDFGQLPEDMSSGNIEQFLAGNLRFLRIFYSVVSLDLRKREAEGPGGWGA